MMLMVVRMTVRTPMVHSSVPVLPLVQGTEQMEQPVLVCTVDLYED